MQARTRVCVTGDGEEKYYSVFLFEDDNGTHKPSHSPWAHRDRGVTLPLLPSPGTSLEQEAAAATFQILSP